MRLTSERSLSKVISMIRSLAFNLFFYVFTLFTALVGIVLVPIPTPVLLRGLLFYWARVVVGAARRIGGMQVEIRGRAHLPVRGPALLANKHQSESDGLDQTSQQHPCLQLARSPHGAQRNARQTCHTP